MKFKKFIMIFFLFFIVVLMQACSNNDKKTSVDNIPSVDEENFNETGMPIVNEPIELNIFASHSPFTADDWNDVLVLNEYEEMTNIHIEWEQIPMSDLEEKTN